VALEEYREWIDLDTKLFLDKITILFKEELRDNLLGIYLHGSLAMGCYNPHKSDIDFLVVVNEKLTPANNSRIAKLALSLHDEMSNERGIEFTIILEKSLFIRLLSSFITLNIIGRNIAQMEIIFAGDLKMRI
jgi:streptomycin 3"-adenylyltransferase